MALDLLLWFLSCSTTPMLQGALQTTPPRDERKGEVELELVWLERSIFSSCANLKRYLGHFM